MKSSVCLLSLSREKEGRTEGKCLDEEVKNSNILRKKKDVRGIFWMVW